MHARRLNAKEVLTQQRSGNFIFHVADGTVKTLGGDQRLKPSTLIKDHLERGEEREVFRGESDELSSPNPLQDDSTHAMMRKLKMILVYYGRFHLSPSRGTKSQTVHAERRITSYS